MHQKRAPAFLSKPALADLRPAARPAAIAAALVGVLALTGCTGLPWGQSAGNIRGGYAAGDKLTVILPGKGPIADAADAVREGVRAAHGADDTPAKPGLAFADGDVPAKVGEVVGEAVKSGATQIVGPLQKPAVDALAGGPALKVPTLALNQSTLGGKATENLYQFALSPDTEGADVANKAHATGFTRALMLYPAGDSGKRRADAFRSRWKRLGGSVSAELGFDPAAKDYQETVTKLLGSQADFLFLSAEPADARKLYPLVRGAASALPVIATSEVFPGTADRALDKDLAGLYFVDLPWVLGVGADRDPLARSKMRKGAPYLSTPLGLRLYAMGIDAYRLAPRLTALAKTPAATFPGQTGTISIDSQGRVQRQLALGRFTEQGPEAVAGLASAKTGGASVSVRPEPARPPAAKPAPTPAKPPKPEPRKTAG